MAARPQEYREFYGGDEPWDTPAYRVTDAARYLHLPASTLRWWVLGGPYPTHGGIEVSSPVIELVDPVRKLLSFRNLVEAHVLSALRRKHKVLLPAVRRSVEYMKRHYGTDHPLSDYRLETDGKAVFVREYIRAEGPTVEAEAKVPSALTEVSEEGQTGLLEVLGKYLQRVSWAASGELLALYPFIDTETLNGPKTIAIDPLMGFGHPTIAGTGLRTDVIVSRFRGGETIEHLAHDYNRPEVEIREALRYEQAA